MDRPIEKRRWPPRKIAGLGIAGIFVIVCVYGFLTSRDSRLNVHAERLTIATVKRGPFQEFIPVVGSVLPIQTIYLDATEGGRVERIFVEAGSRVHEGDEILKLANTNLLLDIMYREAQLFEQSNNLRNTRLLMEQHHLTLRRELIDLDYQIQRQKRTYDRNEELAKRGMISREEYEQARDEYDYLCKRRELALETQEQDSLFRQTQVEQLEASVARMQANLDVVKQKLDNLVIRAAVAGQLTSLHAEIGESKSPGERLGRIDVLEGFKVRAAIDEHYIARVEIGRTGTFDFDDTSYTLIVKKIYPEVREGRFEVDMEFNATSPQDIRRGQTLHIRLELGDLSEAVLLPRGGFYQKTGGQWAYVLDASGSVATKRPVKLGRQNPQVFEVLEGLEPGDQVITSTYDNFGDMDVLVLK